MDSWPKLATCYKWSASRPLAFHCKSIVISRRIRRGKGTGRKATKTFNAIVEWVSLFGLGSQHIVLFAAF